MAEAQANSEVMVLHEVRKASCQARVTQCFSRFVRAIEEKQAAQALMIGLEMQEIATQMLLEAYSLSASLPQEREKPTTER
jgi:hypothetical protein